MRATRGSAGFSLAEVLCAIVILGVGLTGLVQGITTALGSSKEAEVQTKAALIAAGRVELLRAEGYVEEGEWQGECEEFLGPYRWRETVTKTSLEGLYEVVVVVEHTDREAVLYELRTFLFDPPLLSSDRETERREDPRRR